MVTIQKVREQSLVSEEEIDHDYRYLSEHFLIVPCNRDKFFKTIQEAYSCLFGSKMFPLPIDEISKMIIEENVNILSAFSEFTKNTSQECQEKAKMLIDKYYDSNWNIQEEVERIVQLFYPIWDTNDSFLRHGQCILFMDLF